MLKRNPKAATAEQEYRFQEKLISVAAEDSDICEIMEAQGLTVDDLVYKNSRSRSWSGKKPRKLESFAKIAGGVPVASFFTGCGGMDLGLEAVGFSHAAAFEHNEIFCRTLRKNRPHWNVFGPPFHSGDVSKFEEVAEALSPLVTKPFEGVFVGGPPCQPFSIAANQRFARWGDNFKRVGFSHEKNGNLLFDFVNLVTEFMPKAFVIENVPGLRDLDGGEQLSVAVAQLKRSGYTVAEPIVVDAADHGVPQYRQRMFVVGSRGAG
ncbi:MAG: DNA (cytosine-5-)-methyltransferase, partial [Mesorhizobium sp.]|uniref:DNA cytosine methyltransferase n=1 Tax=Mesorhizobium sp. TaxID=1871066 RepID=UPI000FE48FE3